MAELDENAGNLDPPSIFLTLLKKKNHIGICGTNWNYLSWKSKNQGEEEAGDKIFVSYIQIFEGLQCRNGTKFILYSPRKEHRDQQVDIITKQIFFFLVFLSFMSTKSDIY